MIDSAKIGYRISLLGEAILCEGFFDAIEEVRDAEKAEATLPHDRLSEPHGQKELLLRDARENNAAALRPLYARLRSARALREFVEENP